MAQLQLPRQELVDIVHRLRTGGGANEDETNALVERLEKAVDHPAPSDVIFWDRRFYEATDEEVVDELLNYKPILL